MILQALNDHYYRLLDEPESGVAPIGYSSTKVSHVMIIDFQGEVIDFYSICEKQEKRSIPKNLIVPEQIKKTSGIAANFLYENSSYILGVDFVKKANEKKRQLVISKEKFDRFKQDNFSIIQEAKGTYAIAFKNFLNKWNPDFAERHPVISKNLNELETASNIIIKLDTELNYLQDDPELKEYWEKEQIRKDEEEISNKSQCLVTGEIDIIARLHPNIKNVAGAQSSGASLVSFNADSFTSYNKTQSYNSPVSKKAAFSYGTALNYLISSEYNRVRLGDTTMVFWADKKSGVREEQVLSWFLEPNEVTEENGKESDGRRCIDYITALQAKTILERIKAGLPIGDDNFDPDSRCFLLGLAPNAARLSVRFWQISSFGNVLSKIAQHYSDMNIVGLKNNQPPWRILKSIAVQEESRNIPPLLGGQLMKSIISGRMYPRTLYNAALIRCRSGGEHNGVTPIRAAIIKAFLCREYRTNNNKKKEEQITMSLNEDNTNVAYLLGRLFSVLEKLQKDALGSINASIRDRYFGAASATPGSVFPLLLRLSRHHIEKSEYGGLSDRKIQEIVNRIEFFPTHFSLEEQGQFILGYYHQNQANYQKNENNKTNKEGKDNE